MSRELMINRQNEAEHCKRCKRYTPKFELELKLKIVVVMAGCRCCCFCLNEFNSGLHGCMYVCMEWRWAREGKERKCEEQERMNWRDKKMQNKHGRIDMQLVAGCECVTKIKYYFSLWISCVAAMVLRDIFSTVVDEKRIFIGGTQTHSHPHEWMAAYKLKLTQQPKTSIYLRNTLSQRAHFHTVHIDCVCLYVNLYVFRS